MFKPATLFIALRYTRAKRRNHFISFVSLMSMLGIALGVLVLITVLSVMNGFDREIKKKVFSMWPPITISGYMEPIYHWQALQKKLQNNININASAPFINGEVLLTHNGQVEPALLNGIIPSQEKKISQLHNKMLQGKLQNLAAEQFGIVLGETLAAHLSIALGEKLVVVAPQMSMTPAGIIPRYKRFIVVGIFKAGGGLGFDNSLAFIHLEDAARFLQLKQGVSGLHLAIKNVYDAPKIAKELRNILPPTVNISDWTEQFGAFFHAISLEKTMMFVILLFIIAVAVFNLVCTLVMVVNEKKSDIAILRTMGATPSFIMKIFIIQGTMVGLIGTLIGVILGVILSLHITELVKWLETILHHQFLTDNVFFVNYLPSQLQLKDVVEISLVSLFFSLIAVIYPAFSAAKTEIVQALRYE